ncbi:dimethylaniline monooxygenase [N-oxide-forming] 2-like isoform X2 [Acanthaster planci]|nr:dimethylaniline monooxygenase [N-oxide-forming] 2-like isoform X2 [Acanthaster planci]
MKVAIIGAGISGLLAIKTCLEEGMEPHCFERYGQLGGVWVYDKHLRPGQGSAIYDSLTANSSKCLLALSDFPMPHDLPPYPRYYHVLKYFQDYATHFDLEKHITFNTTVLRVEPTADFEATGRWNVRTRTEGCEEVAGVYDAVFVCSGMYKAPHIPDYPGLDEFEGLKMHSNEFRNADCFDDKTVVVMGASNSAGDVTADISRRARQVHISMRHGCWVVRRMAVDSTPIDMMVNRRILQYAPKPIVDRIAMSKASVNYSHDKLGLRAESSLLRSEVMVNDEIGDRIMCGAVQCRPAVKRFTRTGVEFVDGYKIDNLDAVVFATGYKLGFDFIDRSIIQDSYADLDLFMHIFPPKLKHQTLAVIGCVTTLGGQPPVFELQARLAARVFKRLVRLPEQDAMMADVKRRRDILFQNYGKHRIFFPPVPYQEEMAEMIGVKPRFSELFLTNPKLAFQVFFGPCYPATYRLRGPHSWKGAKQVIQESWNSTANATKTRVPMKNQGQGDMVSAQANTLLRIGLAALMIFVALTALIA